MILFSFRLHGFFLSASFMGVLFFLCSSSSVQAAEIPEKLSLIAGDTVRVIEHAELKSWFSVGQTTIFSPSYSPEIEYPQTKCFSLYFYCEAFISREFLSHFVSRETFAVQENRVREQALTIIEEIERPPINAKLALDENNKLTITAEAVPGVAIEREASLRTLIQTLQTENTPIREVRLPTTLVPAKVSRETIDDLRLDTELSQGKTNFRGSPKNRIFNIHRATEQYDGLVIAPGEEFSFVEYLGEVDGDHGYLPELVIRNNKTEPEFGGGICQVSTTVFRAALLAGLEITERKNHSYPVQYYKPYGLDATIYIPRPDLKFKNNTPGAILMMPKIVGTELTITFFGTSDGRTATIDGPHILESNPDGSMRTIFTQTVKDKDGNVFINDTFPSNYKSPSLFPHPGEEILTEKPKNWSSRQWKEYKAIHP